MNLLGSLLLKIGAIDFLNLRQVITTIRCVIAQKSAVLIHFAAEDWNEAKWVLWFIQASEKTAITFLYSIRCLFSINEARESTARYVLHLYMEFSLLRDTYCIFTWNSIYCAIRTASLHGIQFTARYVLHLYMEFSLLRDTYCIFTWNSVYCAIRTASLHGIQFTFVLKDICIYFMVSSNVGEFFKCHLLGYDTMFSGRKLATFRINNNDPKLCNSLPRPHCVIMIQTTNILN